MLNTNKILLTLVEGRPWEKMFAMNELEKLVYYWYKYKVYIIIVVLKSP